MISRNIDIHLDSRSGMQGKRILCVGLIIYLNICLLPCLDIFEYLGLKAPSPCRDCRCLSCCCYHADKDHLGSSSKLISTLRCQGADPEGAIYWSVRINLYPPEGGKPIEHRLATYIPLPQDLTYPQIYQDPPDPIPKTSS